jgi:hypothetical protein
MKVEYNGYKCKVVNWGLHTDTLVLYPVLIQMKIKYKNGDTDWVSANDVKFL